MVHLTWRTTSSKFGPLSNALMILLFIDFLPINNRTQVVESTRMQLGMLFGPPNWLQLHPMQFTLLINVLTLNKYFKLGPQTRMHAT